MSRVTVLWLVLGVLFSPLGSAASLGVWPINPRIDAPSSSTLVWVKNNNQASSVILQARVLAWKQADNSDQYAAQDDLVVSPPLIEVKSDAQQIFRVMNRQGAIKDVTVEGSYRLLIDEVPKENATEGSLLRFQMRYSLPLFVGLPAGYGDKNIATRLKVMAADLRYRVISAPTPEIEVVNNSKFHARISNLIISSNDADAKKLAVGKGLVGYVLPHSVRRWPLDKEQLDMLSRPTVSVIFEQEHQELTIVPEQ